MTQAGADALAHAHRLAEALEEQMMNGLSERERHNFRTWLVQAAKAMESGDADRLQ